MSISDDGLHGPDFLCVGMPKCGTSTLHSVLRNYSDIYVSPFKEIKYFAAAQIGYAGGARAVFFSDHWAAQQERKAMVRILRRVLTGKERIRELLWGARFVFSKRTLSWYRGLFPKDQTSGDLSPAYHMLSRKEIAAIATQLPDLKIIIMLRNPYHQLWSHCRMSARGKDLADDLGFFREQVAYQLRICPSYHELVTRWQEAFGAENVMVEYLENLQDQTPEFARKVISFVDPSPGADDGLENLEADYQVFRGKKVEMPAGVHAILREASAARLNGFQSIDPEWAEAWRDEIAAIDDRLSKAA